MAPRNKGRERGTAKYEDPGRTIVIDVPNVSAAAGVDHYAIEGLLKCVEYYRERGYKVYCVVPSRFLLCDQLENKKKRSDFTYRITAREKLLELQKQQLLVVAPAGSYDDTFAIQVMIRTDGCIVSNDIFRDGTKHAPQKWLDERRISFTFLPITMDFIPNADFVFPPRDVPPYGVAPQTAFPEESFTFHLSESQDDSSEESAEVRRQVPRANDKAQEVNSRMMLRNDTTHVLDSDKQRQRTKTIVQQPTCERYNQQLDTTKTAATTNGKTSKKKRTKSVNKTLVAPETFSPTQVPTELNVDMSMDIEDDLRCAPHSEEPKAKVQEEHQTDDTIVYFTPSGLKIEKPRHTSQPERKLSTQTRKVEYIKLKRRSSAASAQSQKHESDSKVSHGERALASSTVTRELSDENVTFSVSSKPFVPSHKKTPKLTPRVNAEDSSSHEPTEVSRASTFLRSKAPLSLSVRKDTKESKPLVALKKLVAAHQDMGLCQTVSQMVQAQQTRPQTAHCQHHVAQPPASQCFPNSSSPLTPQQFQCNVGAPQGFLCNTPNGQPVWQDFSGAPQVSLHPFGAPQPTAFTGTNLPAVCPPQGFYVAPSGQ